MITTGYLSSIRSQIKRNTVALISMTLALASLSYNTWRNEKTEYNRNVRVAAFEVIVKLGELQRTVFFNHYDHDQVLGSPRNGWAYVLTINDLAEIGAKASPECTSMLLDSWSNNWQGLGENDTAADAIGGAIDDCRALTLNVLHMLR